MEGKPLFSSVRNHLLPILILGLALFVYFSPAIKAGALSAHDYNYLGPPFEFLEVGQEGNGLLADQAESGDPTRAYAINSLKEGRFPFWIPYTGLGEPLTGSTESSILFPLNYFSYFLPYGVATILIGFSKLFIAGVGMYLLVWVLVRSYLVAFFASVAFTFSGFNIVWLGHSHTSVSIWLPWLLLFTWQFFTTKKRVYLLPYASVIALQFFGAHIQTSLHVLSLTGFLALVLTFLKKDWLSFLFFSAASILGFLLAAPQLFPFIEYLFNSLALHIRSKVSRESYLTLSWLVPSFLPNLFGNPAWHVGWFKPHRFFNYNETAMGFPGTLSLFLAPLVLFSKKWRRWGLGIILLILAMVLGMLGVPPFFTFLSKVPLFSLSSNVRLLLLTSFLMIVLAALALDELAGAKVLEKGLGKFKDWGRRNRATLFLSVFVVLIVLIVFFVTLPGVRAFVYKVAAKTSQNFDKGPKQAFFQFGFAFTAFAVLLALKLRRLVTTRLFLVIVIMLVLFDGYLYSWNYNPPFSGEFFATVPEIEYIQENAGYSRVLFNRRALAPNLARAYAIYDLRSRSALGIYPVYQFLRLAGIENRLRMLSATAENKRFLDFLDVRYIAFPKDRQVDLPGLEKVFEGNSMAIYKNSDALARAFTAGKVIKVDSTNEALEFLKSSNFDLRSMVTVEGTDALEFGELSRGTVSIQSLEPERVSLSVGCPGQCFVVLTDTNYPGWVADLNGERTAIYKTDVAFRGVYIPEEGEHTLVFSFTPLSFLAGAATSVLALIVLLGLTFVPIKAWPQVRRKLDPERL